MTYKQDLPLQSLLEYDVWWEYVFQFKVWWNIEVLLWPGNIMFRLYVIPSLLEEYEGTPPPLFDGKGVAKKKISNKVRSQLTSARIGGGGGGDLENLIWGVRGPLQCCYNHDVQS